MSVRFSKIFQLLYLLVSDVWENIANVAGFLRNVVCLKTALSRAQLKKKKRTTESLRVSRNDPHKIQRFNFIREFLINDV